MSRAIACRVAVVVLALVAHGASLRSGFVYDDVRFVLNNAALAERTAGELLLDASTHTTDRDRDVYRPLRALAHRFDARRWGDEPFGFHLHSLLLHALAAWLTLETIRRLLPEVAAGGACFAACLVATHPLGCEVVDWISSRGDLLGYAFGVVAWLGYARGGAAGTVVAGLAAGLAMLGKESAVAVPLVALAHRALVGRGSRSAILAMGAGVAVALVMRQIAVAGASPIQTVPHGGSFPAQLGWALYGAGTTAWHVVWPVGLSVEYPQLDWALAAPYGMPDVLRGWVRLPTLLALALLVATWRARRTRPVLAFALAWAALAYLPSSSAIVTLRSLVNDRMAYPALAGAGVAAAALGWPRAPRVRATLAVLAIGACTLLSIGRAAVFADEASLWTDVLRRAPRDVRAHLGLARAAPTLEAQRRHLERAVEVAPAHTRLDAVARTQLGDLLVHRLDEPEAAIPHLSVALAIGRRERAQGGPVASHELAAVGALADALLLGGHVEQADAALATMIEAAPDVVALHVKRALVWLAGARLGRVGTGEALERARSAAARASALDADHPQVAALVELIEAQASEQPVERSPPADG